MDFKTIEKLLPKFWEGETSLQEEEMLFRYFTSPRIDERHKVYVPYFMVQESYKEAKAPVGLQSSINRKLKKSSSATVFSMKNLWRVAAAIGVLTVGVFLYQEYIQPQSQPEVFYSDTFESPEEALNEIKLALGMVSNKIEESTIMVSNEIMKIDISNNVMY